MTLATVVNCQTHGAMISLLSRVTEVTSRIDHKDRKQSTVLKSVLTYPPSSANLDAHALLAMAEGLKMLI